MVEESRGKIIVIEGSDGAGKKTQSEALYKRLSREGHVVRLVSFPRYNESAGGIVKLYLEGFFGPANELDPKIAITWYALDRRDYWSQQLAIRARIEDIVPHHRIFNRYTSANMIHQGGKILGLLRRLREGKVDEEEKRRLDSEQFPMRNFEQFVRLIERLEFDILKIPRPDKVLLLHVPYEASLELLKKRGDKLDGHEASEEHLRNAEEASLKLVKMYNWTLIECAPEGKMRTIEDISEEVYGKVSPIIGPVFGGEDG